MNITQTPLFGRQYKKLHKNYVPAVNTAIRQIASDIIVGDMKKGDLAGVRVYKFQIKDEMWLLAYEASDGDTILLLALSSHENFYRDLKKYKKHG